MWHRSVNYAAGAIIILHIELPAKLLDHFLRNSKRNINQSSTATVLVWYYAPYSATARRPGVEMTQISVTLLQPVAISTERSTDRPSALDMYNTARSFTRESNTCVIIRLVFINVGFIDLLSCTRSLPPSATSHRRILVCPRISKS